MEENIGQSGPQMTDAEKLASAEPAAATHREDMLRQDPLLDCLVELSRLNGRPATRAALSAGLPLEDGRLTPTLFSRAAARAGLSARMMKKSLSDIDLSLLPVVLLLNDNQACVLLGWEGKDGKPGENAQVLFPETGQGVVSLPREELARRYAGITIFARPHFRFDQRTPELGDLPERHWFWGALKEQWPAYRDVLLAAFIINLAAIVLPLFTMNVYDRIVPNRATDTLWALVLGVLLVIVGEFVLRVVRGRFIDLAGARIDVRLSALIMERVLGMRMEAKPASIGAFAATLRSFESLRDFITSATVVTLIDLPFAFIFIGVMFWIAPLMVIPALVGMFIVVILAYLIQHKMHALSETSYRAAAQRNGILIETLGGLETLKAHGAEGVMQSRWEKTAVFLSLTGIKLRLLSSSATGGTGAVLQLVQVSVIVTGVYLVARGDLSMGGLIACSMLSGRAVAPLGQIVGLLLQYQGSRDALVSLDQLMKLPLERPADASFLHRPELAGDIEFREVSFVYPGSEEKALDRVSLKIKPGEHVGIIGRIGSGKSTLQRLCVGLYQPTDGAIRIDGIDIRQLDPADLRRNVGHVAQDANLFFGTLRENIAIAAPYADDDSVLAASELAGLTEFANRHPMGLDMPVGERGELLSGGQRQSVTIARAVLLQAPIMLFDEPTSGMDYSTEAGLIARLKPYLVGKTLLMSTHRTGLLALVNRLIVMDGGRIVADGPKEEVVAALQSGKVGRAL